MNVKHSLFTWVVIALLSALGVLFVFFYLLLYRGFGVPGSALFAPTAPVFCSHGPHLAVFLVETIHFAIYLGYIARARATHVYAISLSILTADGVISYYGYRYLSRKRQARTTAVGRGLL